MSTLVYFFASIEQSLFTDLFIITVLPFIKDFIVEPRTLLSIGSNTFSAYATFQNARGFLLLRINITCDVFSRLIFLLNNR